LLLFNKKKKKKKKAIFQLINSSNQSTGKDIEMQKWEHLLPRIKESVRY